MDRFKQYIQDHADELDTDLPRDAVWQHIQQQTAPAPKVRPLYRMLAVAACIAGLAAACLWVLHAPSRSSQTELARTDTVPSPVLPGNTGDAGNEAAAIDTRELMAATAQPRHNREAVKNGSVKKAATPAEATNQTNSAAQPEQTSLQEMETGFTHIISLQLEKVRTTPIYSENPGYFSIFKKQFSQLDEQEQEWKKHAAHGLVSEDQLGELINIYQQKLDVLKQLQAEIIKTNKHYKQTHLPSVHNAAFMDI